LEFASAIVISLFMLSDHVTVFAPLNENGVAK
jgi:hypothetical protein